jgi:hypothetical protein
MNRVKRKNTCVATSTDENHLGDYFFDNKGVPQNKFADTLVNEGTISLASAAKIGQLEEHNNSFEAGAAKAGDPVVDVSNCRLGPQNSAEDYMFKVLRMANRTVCGGDIPAILEKMFSNTASHTGVFCQEFLGDPFRALKKIVKQISEKPIRTKALEFVNTLDQDYKKKHQSTNYLEIEKLDADFSKLSKIEKLQQVSAYQKKYNDLLQIIKTEEKKELVNNYHDNWKKILELMFYSRATRYQKIKYKKRLNCLNESLF